MSEQFVPQIDWELGGVSFSDGPDAPSARPGMVWGDGDARFAGDGPVVEGEQIANTLTPLTPADAAKALADGYKKVIGKKPSKKILRLLVGQTAFETGNWKSLHGYNFGNAKATSGDPYYMTFRASEIVNGQEVFSDMKFAAHKTAAEGAAHYIKVLKGRPHWWAGLQTGDSKGFVKGLTTSPAYFTANKDLYQKGLDSRTATFQQYADKYAGLAIGFLGTVGLGAAVTAGYLYLSSQDERAPGWRHS